MARSSDMSGEELQQVLDILSGADSVELKLTLLETEPGRRGRERWGSILSTPRSDRCSSSTLPRT